MEKCHYCGRQYHPMPVYTRPGKRIHVCHIKILAALDSDDVVFVDTDCREQAELEGYEYRRDLTPRR